MICYLLFIIRNRSFHEPLPSEEMVTLSRKKFSDETNKKIRWVTHMYYDWRMFRNGSSDLKNITCDLEDIETINKSDLLFALCRFITEVKKLDGSEFPPKTLYDIIICVQFKLDTLGLSWRLLNDKEFKDLRFTLDNLMKQHTSEGIGITVRKAQVLNEFEEDVLWNMGLLETSNPVTLLNTVVFIIGKGFALRAGKEHRQLRAPPFNSQLTFMKDCTGSTFIRYTEDIGLKTNKGGLKHHKVDTKIVDMYPTNDPNRCPVSIITQYLSLFPVNRNCKSFYLQPKKKFNPQVWYLDRPAGENKLREVVKDLCESAGFPGFFTNHSLRSTSTTTLYQNNVDEQIIQEITGHRSLAVRSYKRTSNSQRKAASNMIFHSQTK